MAVRAHDEDGGIRVLTLDRPPVNAINVELLRDLKTAVDDAARDHGVRVILMRGGERTFSAGLDLKELAAGAGGELARLGRNDGIFALWTVSKPTIAEIGGHAIAGGAILALACDFRVTCEGSHRIGLNETSFGIAFPREALEIARASLPHEIVMRLILEAETFEPAEAKEHGFVHEIVARDQLSDRCMTLARKLAEYPPAGYAHNKQYLLDPALAQCGAETQEARDALTQLWLSAETMHAVIARVAALSKK
ncbi:MAG: hypothetical protein CME06_05610 [Gemmatimonadetes bacterium]|nr:hypothetical protein [Gemmatimonadota bacterium]